MAATIPVKRMPFTLRCVRIILLGSSILNSLAVVATWYTFIFTIQQQQQSLHIVYLIFTVLTSMLYLFVTIVLFAIERKLRSEEPSCCYGFYYYHYYDQC